MFVFSDGWSTKDLVSLVKAGTTLIKRSTRRDTVKVMLQNI